MENKCDMEKKAKEAPSIHDEAYPISSKPSSLESAKSSAANHDEEPGIIIDDEVHVVGVSTKETSSSSSMVQDSFVDVSKYEESSMASSSVSVALSSVSVESTSAVELSLTPEAVVVIVFVVFLHLIVVNWSGEEVARLEVRPSDLVLVGMRQIEEQLGVPVSRQMLVCDEDLLESGQIWSSYSCVRDWSTIQLTTVVQTFDAASDREALMVLFESCGGAGWPKKGGWGSAEPLSSWHGVLLDSEGRVTELILHANRLRGVIPPEIGNLRALTGLNLGSNLLTGFIPPEIGHLTALTHLNLRSNLLTGELPPELGNLTALCGLRLRSNQLTGVIPPALGNLTALTHLLLYENNLTGGIPLELGNLTSLTTLELHSNQLTGAIPIQLGRLKDLDCLSLSGNQLTDQMMDFKFDRIATQQFLGSLGTRYPKRRCAIRL